MISNALLDISKLSKSFIHKNKKLQVLSQIDLTVCLGEFILLSGDSGTGKSTFLSCISGIQQPDSGTVCYKGIDIWQLSKKNRTKQRKADFSFIFQNHNLIRYFSASEQIAFLLQQKGYTAAESLEIALEHLNLVGLYNKKDNIPNELSGGEQQRVSVARALASKAKLIFADEPTSNLDNKNAAIIMDLLARNQETYKTAIICVSHDSRLSNIPSRAYELTPNGLSKIGSR